MVNQKFFIILIATLVAFTEAVQIPEMFLNAKDITEKPELKAVLRKNFPQFQDDENSPTNGKTPFIIGGNLTARGELPYQVLIFTVYPKNEVFLCGGSYINASWVLTAAHCVYTEKNKNYEYLQLYFGVTNVSGEASWMTQIKSNDVVMHKNYNNDNLRNDIAMIKINPPSWLAADRYVGLINLPRNQTNNRFVGAMARASGFGRTSDFGGTVPSLLKFVDLPIITNQQCAGRYLGDIVQDSNICAETTANSGTCSGDSGGPLVYVPEKSIIGVVSFGAAVGCQKGYPAGFTRVTSYIDWIDKTMNSSPKGITVNVLVIAVAQIVLLIWKF